MSQPCAVAVYARISSDPSGAALGVTRHLKDCRARAEALGWPVADEYVDNDVSAFRGARRPEYERMPADLASVDGVIVWHIDRPRTPGSTFGAPSPTRSAELRCFFQTKDGYGASLPSWWCL